MASLTRRMLACTTWAKPNDIFDRHDARKTLVSHRRVRGISFTGTASNCAFRQHHSFTAKLYSVPHSEPHSVIKPALRLPVQRIEIRYSVLQVGAKTARIRYVPTTFDRHRVTPSFPCHKPLLISLSEIPLFLLCRKDFFVAADSKPKGERGQSRTTPEYISGSPGGG